MMWKEFEELAGYEVSYEDYHNIIEPMYMAIPESVSKVEFIAMLDKKRFAKPTLEQTKRALRKEMRSAARSMEEKCGHVSNLGEDLELQSLSRKYCEAVYGEGYRHYDVWPELVYEYEYPELQRGCKYITGIRIWNKYNMVENIKLI